MPSSEKAVTEDLHDLYENAPCGYISADPDGVVVSVNATLLGWIGKARDTVCGTKVHDLFGTGGRIAYETHISPLLRMQGSVHEIALDLRQADGQLIPVIAGASEKRDGADRLQFTRLTFFRSEDRRTYERSLIEARYKAEAEGKQRASDLLLREQFIAVLGHDLRNPLAAIDAGIRLLGRNEDTTPRDRMIMGEMQGSLDRALRLVDDLMDFARGRLGSGIAIDRERAVDLTPALEQVITEVRRIHPARDIQCVLDLREPVFCEIRRVSQLASNLLSNAVFHGAADQPVRLHAASTPDTFELLVCNTGPAIPAAVCDQLFEPFFRADARSSQNGLGLGLFIVNSIAEGHGGAMRVTSDDTETCFIFEMPNEPPISRAAD